IGHVLYRDVLGISNIDYENKKIVLRFTDLDLEQCSGSIPVEDEVIRLEWKRVDNQIQYRLDVPAGYEVTIENRSKNQLVDLDKISTYRQG
ncbi:MAG: hypothetical protein PHQ92_08765, partial [Petrimonas sp.]|nr:hypothetical protein [Petrimonas sp.]